MMSDVEGLVDSLNSITHGPQLQHILEQIGDLARSPEPRTRLVRCVPTLTQFLHDSQHSHILQAWCARALGNIAVDNDDGRAAMLSSGAVLHLVALGTTHPKEHWVMRNVVGALANIVGDNSNLQKAVLETGGLNIALSALVGQDAPDVFYLTLQFLYNMSMHAPAQSVMLDLKILEHIVAKVKSQKHMIEEYLWLVPRLVGAYEAVHVDRFKSSGIIELLVSFLGSLDDTLREHLFDALFEMSHKPEYAPALANIGIEEKLCGLLDQKEEPGSEKTLQILELLMGISTNESSAEKLVTELYILDRLEVFLLESKSRSRSLALGTVGNLMHNTAIVDFTLKNQSNLLQLITTKCLGEDLQDTQLTCSSLRNILAFASDKSFVSRDFVSHLVALLGSVQVDSENGMGGRVLMGILANLRILIKTSSTITQLIIDCNAIHHFLKLFADSSIDSIRFESCRNLYYISTWPDHCKSLMMEQTVSKTVDFLIESPYEILQEEGVKYLCNLCIHCRDECPEEFISSLLGNLQPHRSSKIASIIHSSMNQFNLEVLNRILQAENQ